jgi:hypothetical protein
MTGSEAQMGPGRPDDPADGSKSGPAPGQYVSGPDLPLRPAVPVTGEEDPAGDDGRRGEQNDPGDGQYVPL